MKNGQVFCPSVFAKNKTAPKNGADKFSIVNQLTFALMYFAISS